MSREQSDACQAALSESVFLTGPAGSGKSACVRVLVRALHERVPGSKVCMVAFTGTAVAAFERGGSLCAATTVHSMFNVPVDRNVKRGKLTFMPYRETANASDMETLRKRLLSVSTLIIDEVSMMSAYLLHWMNDALRWARVSTDPFGGASVVLERHASVRPHVHLCHS